MARRSVCSFIIIDRRYSSTRTRMLCLTIRSSILSTKIISYIYITEVLVSVPILSSIPVPTKCPVDLVRVIFPDVENILFDVYNRRPTINVGNHQSLKAQNWSIDKANLSLTFDFYRQSPKTKSISYSFT